MTTAEPAEFVLGPATRLLWRSPDTVHLELGSEAVLVEGLPLPVLSRIASREPAGPPAAVDATTSEALHELADAGYLWARRPDPAEPDDRLIPPAPRLAGELTSLAARHGESAAELLDARRHTRVTVYGHGRAGSHLAALLAAAGVGRVHCSAAGPVRLFHPAPGGVEPREEGLDLAAAADAAIRRAAPEVDTTPLPIGEMPDLTVLAVDTPVGENRRAALHAARAAHLVVSVGVDYGVVGPLVLPGLTSCLRCADLHRRDRDPAWAALAVQLSTTRRYGPSSDVAVATMVVGAAAIQALTFLDGGEPACIDGTLEIRLPDWRLRRRSWGAHPDCDCFARRDRHDLDG